MEAVLAFVHQFGRVEAQGLHAAAEVGGGDEQVERVARW
jgi:hypothetical protein